MVVGHSAVFYFTAKHWKNCQVFVRLFRPNLNVVYVIFYYFCHSCVLLSPLFFYFNIGV